MAIHPIEDLDGPVLEVSSLGLKLVCWSGQSWRGPEAFLLLPSHCLRQGWVYAATDQYHIA